MDRRGGTDEDPLSGRELGTPQQSLHARKRTVGDRTAVAHDHPVLALDANVHRSSLFTATDKVSRYLAEAG